jgi:hypothetical protein
VGLRQHLGEQAEIGHRLLLAGRLDRRVTVAGEIAPERLQELVGGLERRGRGNRF